MKNKMIGTILVLCILLTFVPYVQAATIVGSGTCGDNVMWKFDDEGTLTISGEGEMEDFVWNQHAPWYWDYNWKIKNIYIQNGVTSIGEYAFESCGNLENIYIPNSVIRIGQYAFQHCHDLTEVKLPENLEVLGRYAFCACYSLQNISIPSTLKQIEAGTFGVCKNLTALYLPQGIENVQWGAFYSCENLETIFIPDSVTYIAPSVFSDCGRLNIEVSDTNENYSDIDGVLFNKDQTRLLEYSKDIIQPNYSIPYGVTAIEQQAFLDRKALKSISIPETMAEVGNWAFSGCHSLTDVEIPVGVLSIGTASFQETAIKQIVIPESVKSIGEYAFALCELKVASVPDSVTATMNQIFAYNDELTDVYYGGTENQWNTLYYGRLRDVTVHFNSGRIPLPEIEDSTQITVENEKTTICVDFVVPYESELIVILYENNKLTDIKSTKVKSENYSKNFEFENNRATEAKILMWESLTNMKSLCKGKTIPLSNYTDY